MSYSLGIWSLEQRQHMIDTIDPGVQGLARLRYDQATAAYQAGDYEAAIRFYTEAWTLVPHPAVLVAIGLTMKSLGRFQDAAYRFQRYLRENPEGSERVRAQEGLASAQIAMEQEAAARSAPPPPRPVEIPAAMMAQKVAEAPTPQQVMQQTPSPLEMADPYAERATYGVWIATGVGVAALAGLGWWLSRRRPKPVPNRRRRARRSSRLH
jgi:tetratricopeptide (TPR) repeat protein